MAFDSTSPGPTGRRPVGGALPEAPRPGAELWRTLREEAIQWEGQVLVVGDGLDIPALLVLTSERVALIHEGTLALEAPRGWLRPEPRLLSENGIRISVTPQGGPARNGGTDRLTVRARDGRGAAARFVSAVSGRLVSPREERAIPSSSASNGWSTEAGAAASIALPPLPDFGMPAETADQRAWPPVEHEALPAASPTLRGKAPNRDGDVSAASASRYAWPDAAPRRDTWVTATVPPEPTPDEEHRPFNRGLVWGLRSAILGIAIFTALYFGGDRLPASVDDLRLPAALEDRFGLDDDGSDGNDEVSQLAGTGDEPDAPVPTQANSDGTNGAPNGEQPEPTEDGAVGGQDGVITPADPGIGTYADPTSAAEAEGPTADGPAEAEETVSAAAPTVPAATEPPVAEEPETEVPVVEEPATEDPGLETPPTEQPATELPATEPPATEPTIPETVTVDPSAPTEVPGRQDATETAPTPEPTAAPTIAPASEVPTPTLEPQPASVDPGSTPEQALASGAFRYSITGAARGETLADLPEVNAVGGYGEWIVLSMYGQNWSDAEQVFDISEFRLYADGQEVLLDVGNAWVSGLLGQTPAYGNTDAILWAADEGHPFALTFLAPPGAQQLILVAGDQSIDLSAALAEPAPLVREATTATLPQTLEVEVVDVLGADEIVVRVDGVEQAVRYLGLDVPSGDDCFATDATEANRQLVAGKTVRLERQATDIDARGNWVRDVWAPDDDGRYFLVAEELVAQGAATAGISEPNTRYAGWLTGSESIARNEGRGLWGACQDEAADAPEQQAIVPAPIQRSFQRVARRN